MKILLVNKYFFLKGGAERVFFSEADLLRSRGHEIVFLSTKHLKNLKLGLKEYFLSFFGFENLGFAHYLRFANNILYSWPAKKLVNQIIDIEKPVVAHLHNIYHQISPSIIHSLKKRNIPVVMSLHDYKLVCPSYLMLANKKICEACKGGRYYFCLLKRCVKKSVLGSVLGTAEMYLHHNLLRIYNEVDIFISPSKFLLEKVTEMGFRGKITYLPNFVKSSDYTPSFINSEFSISYIGRISEEKGIETLIAAIKDIPNLTLKIVGDGPLRKFLENSLSSWGDNDKKRIRFLGHLEISVLKKEISKSMFVVLPSECYENNPLSVIESFALGKPVIGARIGGIPELVKNKITGITFEPGSVDDLKDKILYLAAQPDLIKEMGMNARRLVEEELNEEKHYEGLMKIYKYAIEKNKKVQY